MRKLLLIVGGLVALLVVLALLLPFFIDANKFRPQIESAASEALNRKVQIGNIRLALFSGGVAAEDLSIADDPAFGTSAFLTAKSLAVGVEMMPLIFSRELHVTGVTIEEPHVTLLRNRSGIWNFSSMGTKGTEAKPAESNSAPASASSTPGNVSVQKLTIKNGELSVGNVGSNKRHDYQQLNFEAQNLSYTSQFPFTMTMSTPGNGTVKLDGQAGPLNQTNAAATPVSAKLDVHNLDLTTTGFMDPASGIAGVLDFTGTLGSDGKKLTSKGSITATKLKLVPAGSPAGEPLKVDYGTEYAMESQTGTLEQGDVHIGKALAHLTGTFNNSGDVASVMMKLAGSAMPASDLQTVLPAVGMTLPSGASLKEGTLDVNLAISGPVTALVTTGPVKLSNAKLAGFDLGEKMGALSSFAGVPKGSDTVIETFSSDLRVAPEGIRSDNLNLVVPSIGNLTGNGTIDAKQELNFKMVARLTGSSAMGKLASMAGGGASGSGIPFTIQGTTSKPTFVPDMSAMTKGMLKGAASGITSGVAPNGQDLGNIGKQLGGLFGKKKSQ